MENKNFEYKTIGECNYPYTKFDTDKLVITRYIGTSTKVRIPKTINKATVVSTQNHAFVDCGFITDVIISEGFVQFGWYTFWKCTGVM